jgi:hypothetical protein
MVVAKSRFNTTALEPRRSARYKYRHHVGRLRLGHERTCLVYLDVRFTRKRISGRAAKASLLALDGLFNARLPIIISPDRRPDPAKGTWEINAKRQAHEL